jgi:hypothetical protein
MNDPNQLRLFREELDKRALALDSKLSTLIEKNIFTKLELGEQDNVAMTQRNIQLIAEGQQLILVYAQNNQAFFKFYAKGLTEIVKSSESYFSTLTSAEAVKLTERATTSILNKIGLTPTGSIIEGGFIHKQSAMPYAQQRMTDFILKNAGVGVSYQDLLNNWQNEMGGQVEGFTSRYVKTELHDITMRFARSINNVRAVVLGLNYFVYARTEIDTTREFCQERIGKVFHRKDVESFPTDLSYFPPNYDFYEDLGGYNCRHILRWLSNIQGAKLYENTN